MSIFARLKRKVTTDDDFLRSVFTLTGGTALSQLIMIGMLPFITRLYTPEEFGVLAIFLSYVLLVSVSACLRYDVAIPLANDDREAKQLLILSVLMAALVSGVTWIILYLNTMALFGNMRSTDTTLLLVMIPLGVFVSGSYGAVQFWATRRKAFGQIANSRVRQAVSGGGFQLAWGAVLNGGTFGLLVGQFIYFSAGIIYLSRSVINERAGWGNMRLRPLMEVLLRYRRFPQYSAPEAIMNSASLQVPLIIIAASLSSVEVGFIMLAQRVMQAPMSLLGTSIGQAYLSKAPAENSQGNLAAFSSTILAGLIRVGVGPIIFIGIIAAPVFSLAFGSEWTRAGELVKWMTPWFVLQFLVSPLAMSLHVLNEQGIALAVQCFGFVIRVGTLCIAYFLSPDRLAEAYAISGFVFYLSYLVIIWWRTKMSIKDVTAGLGSSVLIIFSFGLVGGLIKYCWQYI